MHAANKSFENLSSTRWGQSTIWPNESIILVQGKIDTVEREQKIIPSPEKIQKNVSNGFQIISTALLW